jgi:DNA-binding CsgD family transcriptional regulator
MFGMESITGALARHSRRITAISGTTEIGTEVPCSYLALVVVDAGARIKHSFWNGSEGDSVKLQMCDPDCTLRSEIATIVTELIAYQRLAGSESCIVLRDGGRTLRLSPLAGPEGELSVLVMEADSRDGTIERAARQYRLTRRQTEVLGLVLDGASTSDVAHALVISEYTAQGYFKSLLAKTNSRNRAGMVAKVLNWKQRREWQDEEQRVAETGVR